MRSKWFFFLASMPVIACFGSLQDEPAASVGADGGGVDSTVGVDAVNAVDAPGVVVDAMNEGDANAPVRDAGGCPKIVRNGFVVIADVVWPKNCHGYKVLTGNATWEEAKLAAEQAGGYLAVPNEEGENEVIYALAKQKNLPVLCAGGGNRFCGPWLGGYQVPDAATRAGWRWITTDSFPVIANWNQEEPNDGNSGNNTEDVMGYYNLNDSGATWADFQRGSTYRLIVEFEPTP